MPKIADVVVGLEYDLPGGGKGKKWQRVGALIQVPGSDPKKGPGFVIALDRHFNPAGVPVPAGTDPTSVMLGTFYPNEPTTGVADVRPPAHQYKRPPKKPADQPKRPSLHDIADDDIPF